MKQERQGTLTVVVTEGGPGEHEICADLAAEYYTVHSCSLAYTVATEIQELTCHLSWRAVAFDARVPEFVRARMRHEGVAKVSWSPQSR
jgi:hypothetical protein